MAISVDGPPMPVEQAEIGVPWTIPRMERYSRWSATDSA